MSDRTRAAAQSLALIAILVVQAAVVGWLLGGVVGALLAVVLGSALAAGARRVSSWAVLRMLGGRPLRPVEAPRVYALLATLARRAGLSRVPQLVLLRSDVPNAMTLGSRDAPVVGVTRGLVQQLPERELAAVLAHEIGHIVQEDTKMMATARAYAQVTGWAGQAGLLLVLLGAVLGAAQAAWVGLVLTLGPPAANLVMMALSRQREFEADRLAVELTGDPAGLAVALRRIDARGRLLQRWFGLPGGDPPALLRSHPATEARVERLRRVAAAGAPR